MNEQIVVISLGARFNNLTPIADRSNSALYKAVYHDNGVDVTEVYIPHRTEPLKTVPLGFRDFILFCEFHTLSQISVWVGDTFIGTIWDKKFFEWSGLGR